MKKFTLTLFAVSLLSATSFAQGFYLRFGLGYGFAQAGQSIDGTSTPYNGSVTYSPYIQTYSIKSASFSAGLQGTLGIGYMINEHVGLQLDANIGLANKKYTLDLNNVSVGGVASNVSIIQQAKTPFILMPQLVLESGGNKACLYGRFGLALPFSTKMTLDQVIRNAPGTGATTVDDFTFDVKNSFSLGFTGAAGVRYKLNDRVSIWGELSVLSLSVFIKQSDLKAVTENGQSVPLGYVSGPLSVKYSKNATVDSNGTTAPAYTQPFSNVGLHFGVSFSLSQHSSRHSSKYNKDDADNKKPYKRR